MPALPRLLLALLLGFGSQARAASFRAGAFASDISPTGFPVRVNAMFTERSADKVADPLFAKALALDDGSSRLVICVVDSCMVPRDLIDRAKAAASKSTGIPIERMLVSSTHTHSAPSAMGCLGSRVDPGYAAFLPGRIAAAIIGAVERLAPARIGWAQVDDWEHTFNRRWIRRPDKLLTDPFGEKNVRANMHPGHESPDAIGPSGPVDPQLSVLAVQRIDGKPLALLANYSQHYYGSPLLSSDYYGRFARHVATMLAADDSFVGIMSQGTSGDLMWMDYSAPRREIGYDIYAREIAERVAAMVREMSWQDSATLAMAERKLELGYRVPDEKRLAWARETAAKLGGKLPQAQPEIYALEALYLHERPRTELKVQALRIGELGIAALPNEVFAISGLKLKRRSPFAATFNIELANGAEGYIPPPEQHRLGGYTTWAARTAGLETNAEPRIVETALALLEQVASRPRRDVPPEIGSYAQAVLDSKPAAYWRFEEMGGPIAFDALGKHNATIENGVALHLPGADARIGHQPARPTTPNAFSGSNINRALHFAGGRVSAAVPLGDSYSAEAWIWNGLPATARAVTGFFFSRSARLGIGGTNRADSAGRLIFDSGDSIKDTFAGRTPLLFRAWHHVALVSDGRKFRVYLDGRGEPEIEGSLKDLPRHDTNAVFIGGSADGQFNFEGKMDEVALYPRALAASEIHAHYQAASITRPSPANNDAARAFPRVLYASEGAGKIIEYAGDGSIAWDYPAEYSRDVWQLPNGNVLFCYNRDYHSARNDNPSGVMEITRDKRIAWQFSTTGQVWSCQRLADGSTLVGASSQGKLLIVSPRQQVLREIVLRNKPGHGCIRNARQTPEGTFLVAEESARSAREYGPDGGFLREFKVAFAPYSAIRLPNGGTLVCGQKSMVEFDASGRTSWSLEGAEIPEMGIRWFAGIQVLPGGNIFIANAGGAMPLLEISREKKVVWSSGPASARIPLGHGIHRLDAPMPGLK